MENLQTVFVKEVEKPERKCILKRGVTATEYWTYCQEVGCDVWGILTSIPSLPATTLTVGCYAYMFQTCTRLKLSATQTGTYTKEYRIPATGAGTTATNALSGMFHLAGGTFTGTPEINTTYYLHKDCVIV